jgi:uroporphyrinogen decarboxylase
MTDSQWKRLLNVVNGAPCEKPPLGFIVDCPWLPGWVGREVSDYLTNQDIWLNANKRANDIFPECSFIPGFWSEFGMCTEPSAFGGRCQFPRNDFPFIQPLTTSIETAAQLSEPDPRTDGLLPFMLSRLKWAQPRLEEMGHPVRFSVSRGPLNIASFVMGTTDFLLAIKTDPELAHQFLRTITSFLKHWHELQRETFPSIQGIMILDDIVGFLSEKDFLEFAAPYLKELYNVDLPVRLFHNDAECAASLAHYSDLGINLYNPGFQLPFEEIRRRGGPKLAILGGVPPRDVLGAGTPEAVTAAVKRLLAESTDNSRWMISCSGGVPQGVSTINMRAFIEAAS